MALSTFAELKASIATWADRTDLTSTIPDFITLAESAINNGDAVNDIAGLRVREMENSTTITVTSGSGSLPTGFVAMKRVYSATSSRVLEYVTPEWYLAQYPDGDGGYPIYYTIIGSNILVSTDVTVIYYLKVPALSDSNTTNWLLTKAPNVYLFGSLFYLEIYSKNPEAAVAHRTLFGNAMTALAATDTLHRGGSFTVRASGIAQ